MAAEKGRILRIKLGDGESPEVFTAIGGIVSESLSINSSEVEINDKDGAGWRKLLEGAGIRSVGISGNGIFNDTATEQLLADTALSGTHLNLEFVINTSGDKLAGKFQVTQFEFSGEEGGAVQYSCSFASTGAVTMTRA